MYGDVEKLVRVLGGYRKVASRVGIGATTLHGYITEGMLPAKYYFAFVELSGEANLAPPSRKIFKFAELQAVDMELPQVERGAA